MFNTTQKDLNRYFASKKRECFQQLHTSYKIPTILRRAISLKDYETESTTRKKSFKTKQNCTSKFYSSMCHSLNRYTSKNFVYDILLIKDIKYMVNSHLSVRRNSTKRPRLLIVLKTNKFKAQFGQKKSSYGR